MALEAMYEKEKRATVRIYAVREKVRKVRQ
jgi:hypothetical protein